MILECGMHTKCRLIIECDLYYNYTIKKSFGKNELLN